MIKLFFAIILTFLIGILVWWQPYPLILTSKVDIQNLPARVQKIIAGANSQLGKTLFYDPRYVELEYPLGDINIVRGVCTDVVIRALRNANFDLQVKIHEDMKDNFSHYPNKWGLKSPDKNIDHRRVPNLAVFFDRNGWSLPIDQDKESYMPGDIVTWVLPNGRDHIGIISEIKSYFTNTPLVIHNSKIGAQMEDVLFKWKITGHYRFKIK